MESIGGSGWSLRAGRFDLLDEKGKPLFGNGMVLLDGTPRDGGRSLYFDGVLATYRPDNERDTFRLAALYGDSKEWLYAINDQDRSLRRGDTWIGGGSWVHSFCKEFNTELYYYQRHHSQWQ